MTVLLGVARIALWLLTPLVVWAASFFGAWVGAALTQAELRLVGLGGILGGGLGFAAWLFVLRSAEMRYRSRSGRRGRGRRPSEEGDPGH